MIKEFKILVINQPGGDSLHFQNFLNNKGIGEIRRCLSMSMVSLPILLCIIKGAF